MNNQFPWNSSYAFSENRVNDGIELERREFSPLYFGVGDVFVNDNVIAENAISETFRPVNISEVGKLIGDVATRATGELVKTSQAAASDYHPFPMPFSYDANYNWIKKAGKLIEKTKNSTAQKNVGEYSTSNRNGNKNGFQRRKESEGDQKMPSKRAARREAFRRNKVRTSESNNYQRRVDPDDKTFFKYHSKDIYGDDVQIKEHPDGHFFKDDHTYEEPHFHGPEDKGHITYPF